MTTSQLVSLDSTVRGALARRPPDVMNSPATTVPPVLLAVGKRQPDDRLLWAYDEGIREFGENYVRDLVARRNLLPADASLHLVGKVQRNKISRALQAADWIHTVYSLHNLQHFEKRISSC